jgi:peptidoglycan hydrolase CwlO-like protein
MGAISKIIEEYRQRSADLDELRKLHLELRHAKASSADALRGAQFLRTLDELEFDSKHLPECLEFIKDAREDAPELASAGIRLIELEKKAEKPYEQLLSEFAEKLKAEAESSMRVKTLEDRELKLSTSISHLEKLTMLQETMDRNNITPGILGDLIRNGLRLQELGFTPTQAEVLAKELEGRRLDPATAAAQIARLLRECSDLEEAKKKATAEAEKSQLELDTLRNNATSLGTKCKDLREQLRKLEDGYRERKGFLEKQYEALQSEDYKRKEELEAEFLKRKEEIETEIHKLQNKAADLKTEIERLESAKANMSEAEADLQKIEERIATSRMLATLVSLVKDPMSLKATGKAVEAMLAVSEGFRKYLETTDLISWRNKPNLREALDRLSKSLLQEVVP